MENLRHQIVILKLINLYVLHRGIANVKFGHALIFDMPRKIFSYVAGMSKERLFDKISKLEISKYYVIIVYFQAAVSALLAVSVLYFEKKLGIGCVNIRKFAILSHIK